MIKWWGYIHKNGTLQVKRFFSQQDLDEALESPFCIQVSNVVEAVDREEAIKLLTKDLSA